MAAASSSPTSPALRAARTSPTRSRSARASRCALRRARASTRYPSNGSTSPVLASGPSVRARAGVASGHQSTSPSSLRSWAVGTTILRPTRMLGIWPAPTPSYALLRPIPRISPASSTVTVGRSRQLFSSSCVTAASLMLFSLSLSASGLCTAFASRRLWYGMPYRTVLVSGR